MHHDATHLAETLADQAAAVTPVTFRSRLLTWLGVGVVGGSIAVILIGTRQDVAERLHSASFTFGLASFAVGFVLASWIAWRQAMPGRELSPVWPWCAAAALAAFSGYFGYTGFLEGGPHESPSLFADLACCLRMAAGGFIPNVILIWMVSRTSPNHLRASVGAIMLASSFIVVFASQLNCPFDDVRHVLLGHGAMIVSLNLATYAFYRTLFRNLCRKEFASRLLGSGVIAARTK